MRWPLSREQLEQVEALLDAQGDRTHYEGCVVAHPLCALRLYVECHRASLDAFRTDEDRAATGERWL